MVDLLSDVAKVLDLWLQTPVPLIFGKQRVLVKEAVEIVSTTVAALCLSPRLRRTYPE